MYCCSYYAVSGFSDAVLNCLLTSNLQVLELQQNLAVAVSIDRKKDLTIEQMDKVNKNIYLFACSLTHLLTVLKITYCKVLVTYRHLQISSHVNSEQCMTTLSVPFFWQNMPVATFVFAYARHFESFQNIMPRPNNWFHWWVVCFGAAWMYTIVQLNDVTLHA